jgi:hypothetical protein
MLQLALQLGQPVRIAHIPLSLMGRDAWLNPRHFLRANEGVKPWHGASHDAHCLFRISACASSRGRYADHVAGCPN